MAKDYLRVTLASIFESRGTRHRFAAQNPVWTFDPARRRNETMGLGKETVAALFVLGGIFIAAGITKFAPPADSQLKKPTIDGRIWISGEHEAKLLHYVTQEQRRSRSFRKRGPENKSSKYYSRYHLHSHSVDNGAVVKTTTLAEFSDASGKGPHILGSTTGTLWLWNTGLEARDPATLNIRLTQEQLRARNPELGKMLPKESKFAKVSDPHGSLLFKGLDTRFYQVDSATGAISEADLEPLAKLSYNKTAEEGFDRVPATGASTYHTSPNSFQVDKFITITKKWYALLSPDERQKLYKWPPKPGRPWGDVARSLYVTDYTIDDTYEIEIDPAQVTEVGKQRFVQGGFLIRREGAVWDVPNPSSTLVLFKDALGADEPWQFARVARDGSIVWKQSTGLTDFDEIADGGTKVLLHGHATVDPKKLNEHEEIVLLEPATGSITRIAIAQLKVEEEPKD